MTQLGLPRHENRFVQSFLNKEELLSRAEIVREIGTDRNRYYRGESTKYTWQDVGSSFVLGELGASFLWPQLKESQAIIARRLALWSYYHELLLEAEMNFLLRRPILPAECEHNGHIYYVLLPADRDRSAILAFLRAQGIHAAFHYVPLHSSSAGQTYCRTHGGMTHTERLSNRLVRLPLWIGLTPRAQERIVLALLEAIIHGVSGS